MLREVHSHTDTLMFSTRILMDTTTQSTMPLLQEQPGNSLHPTLTCQSLLSSATSLGMPRHIQTPLLYGKHSSVTSSTALKSSSINSCAQERPNGMLRTVLLFSCLTAMTVMDLSIPLAERRDSSFSVIKTTPFLKTVITMMQKWPKRQTCMLHTQVPLPTTSTC